MSQEFATASGTSIQKDKRDVTAFSLLWKQQLSPKLHYGIQLRQEFVPTYKVPLLYALDAAYQWSKSNVLKANYSKNFRVPSFNDLYWLGQGNPDLLPEVSQQFSVSQNYEGEWATLRSSLFYIQTAQMIQWRPNTNGIWRPANLRQAKNFGLEFFAKIETAIKESKWALEGEMAYTRAKDAISNHFLVYVPALSFRGRLAIKRKKWESYLGLRITDAVYTTTDNSKIMPSFSEMNAGLTYTFIQRKTMKNTIGLRVQNLANQKYFLLPARPAPNRNVTVQLQINY